ncbi:MAG: hypothetical protein A2408_01600 [Candidatus Yonathbacteria bacterium RIFOXYC1_FULL_52_10]|uniref:Lipid/polyisoprenoid-binding YceI-like domain-containing protein n=1 Tax=Candidatus Yonathbacteria bacterium RIFOXYD1_FULL_52_36 TaxID=1802730 RepID=A0A1G2SL05_9BACT|nr:MAG: hypothetical protein A2408_01600 [Candidatus Yonathbacteria bacterium RIFOXYC1_FULL_52_10]OHA85765.1 MAG: hypothetical protein A2591_02770 [Candidatus Yonathbacteria bacterium RIFOXYD1_FULL_52_36]
MNALLKGFVGALFALLSIFGSTMASAAGTVTVSGTIWQLTSSSDCHVSYNILTVAGTGATPSRLQWQATASQYYTDWCSNLTSELVGNTALGPQTVTFNAGRITVNGIAVSIPGGSTLAFIGKLVPVGALTMPNGRKGAVSVQLEAVVVGEFYVDSNLVLPNDLSASITVSRKAK